MFLGQGFQKLQREETDRQTDGTECITINVPDLIQFRNVISLFVYR